MDVEEIILIVTNVNVDDHILDPSTVIINPTVSPGIIDDVGTYNISASIVTQNAIKLADVDVIFNQGINSSSYKSTANGSVSGALTAGSAATVKASLAYSSLTKAISSQDALDALKLSVGLSTSAGTMTSFDFMSADFNQDGKVLFSRCSFYS